MAINVIRLLNNTFSTRLDTSRSAAKQSASNVALLERDPDEALTLLGTTLFMPVSLDGLRLPNEPIIEINGANVLIRTQMDNDNGTFKELFARDDFQITIRGFCVNDSSSKFPEAQLKQIYQWCRKEGSLKIENRMCRYLGIFNFVIEKFNFPSLEGFENAQPYELIGYSDNDFEIELEK